MPFDVTNPDSSIPFLSTVWASSFLGMAVALDRAPAQAPDTMPIVNRTGDSAKLLAQAVALLNQAVELIGKAAPGLSDNVRQGLADMSVHGPTRASQPIPPPRNGSARSQITDRANFSVRWGNRTCRLGNTLAFKLLDRLAQRPGLYLHYDKLLSEFWDCHTSPEAVRSTVKILRRKLRAAGMGDLAKAIDGSNSHHYGLKLTGRT
jgi:DNA-binding response OmpR family regulator